MAAVPTNRPILQRIFRHHAEYEPFRFAILRTSVALVSIAFLVAFAWDLVKQIIDEQFSTRGYTVVQPFNNVTKFGMVGMPSILVITNILGHPTFENSPYLSVAVSVGCWNPDLGNGSFCPCTLSWHQSLVQNTVDQLQWNPSYQCWMIASQRTDAVWVNITMNSTYATSLGVWDNTQLIVFDPNSQALGNIDSYLNATGEPNERAFLTPFSLYYNFGFLMRYSVEFSSLRKLKTSWRDIIGLTGLYQSVNLYTIDPIPINGISQSQYQMTSVLYPAWGISPGGLGFGVTEDFRTHTIPALLASLGGLWTILNALFSWLFGRTLLFPVFGNAPISAFGFMGKVMGWVLNRQRKEGIQSHIQRMGLNQIIREFVIDLTPFVVPSENPTYQDEEQAQPETQNFYTPLAPNAERRWTNTTTSIPSENPTDQYEEQAQLEMQNYFTPLAPHAAAERRWATIPSENPTDQYEEQAQTQNYFTPLAPNAERRWTTSIPSETPYE